MKKYIHFIVLIMFLSYCSISCTTVKRYKHLEPSETNNSLVSIDLFDSRIEDTSKTTDNSKTLWNLAAEGQAELIKTFDKRDTSNEKFSEALSTPYFKSEPDPTLDYTNKDLQMVFSISKTKNYEDLGKAGYNNFTLADRIEYIKFDIIIPDSINLNFTKWNKYSTEYDTIDIGDLSFTKSLEIGPSNNPYVSGKASSSRTEAQKVRHRFMKLNGKISDKKIEMEEEGEREIDLSGNVIADVNLKFNEYIQEAFTAENLKKDKKYNAPKDVNLNFYSVKVPDLPNIPEKIEADLKCSYAYRHVLKKEKTFYEWDDKIKYFTGSFNKKVTLFKKKDFIPEFYSIGLRLDNTLPRNQQREIKLRDTVSEKTYDLVFLDRKQALDFLNWLQNFPCTKPDIDKSIFIGQYQLLLKDVALTKNIIQQNIDNLSDLHYYR